MTLTPLVWWLLLWAFVCFDGTLGGRRLRSAARRQLLKPRSCMNQSDCADNWSCIPNLYGPEGFCLGNLGTSCLIDYLCTSNVCEPYFCVCSLRCEDSASCPRNFTCNAQKLCSPVTRKLPLGAQCDRDDACFSGFCYNIPSTLVQQANRKSGTTATNVLSASSPLNGTSSEPSFCSKNCDLASPWFACPAGTFCYVRTGRWAGYCVPNKYYSDRVAAATTAAAQSNPVLAL